MAEEERDIDSNYYRIGGDPLYVDANDLAHEIHGDVLLGSKDGASTVKVRGKLELPDISMLKIGDGSKRNSIGPGEILVVNADGSLDKIKASAPGQIPVVNQDGTLTFADADELFQPIAQKNAERQMSLGLYKTYGIFVRKKGTSILTPGSRVVIGGWSIEDNASADPPASPGESLFYVSEDASFDFDKGAYVVQEDGPHEIEINLELSTKSSAGSVTLFLMVDGKMRSEMPRQFNSNPRYPTSVHANLKPKLKKGKVISIGAYFEGSDRSTVVVLPTSNTTWSVRRLPKE